jgi:hypothetical protein
MVSNDVLPFSVVFKYIAMIIGVLGNVSYNLYNSREQGKDSNILSGRKLGNGSIFSCV